MPAELRIDFATGGDPLDALATFTDLAAPIFERFGYTPEEKDPRASRDWMHWNRDYQNVVRAYAFRTADQAGVSVLGQGEIPEGLGEALIRRVAESTDWRFANPA